MPLADFPALLDRIEQGATTPDDVSTLHRLAEAAPGHVTAHVALARVLERGERWAEARRSWQRAALLLPGSPAVHAGLHRVRHHLAEKTSAEKAPAEEVTAEEPVAEKDPSSRSEAPEAPPTKDAQEAPAAQAPSAASGHAALHERATSLPQQPDDDLDRLIEELEGARIEPTPDPDDVPAPDLDADDRDVVSPTLARIYEAQGQYAEAARVYRRLAEQRPAEADAYRRQAEALQARAEEEPADEE